MIIRQWTIAHWETGNIPQIESLHTFVTTRRHLRALQCIAPLKNCHPLFGHRPNSDCTPPPHSNGHSGALYFQADSSKFSNNLHKFLAALAALYIPDLGQWVGESVTHCQFRILTQRVTFRLETLSDI